jgi:sulfate permease, SulP family
VQATRAPRRPARHWLMDYRPEHLAGDLVAGVVVAVMLVPQAMAYAALAGLPPEAGLYASLLPLVVYALLGSSRHLAVGPVAIVALMTASALAPHATPGTPEYLGLALLLALLSGAWLLLMGVLRLGFLVNFLGHTVIVGFTAAAAIVIAASQLRHLLGADLPRSDSVVELALHALRHPPAIEPWTAAMGLGAVALLLLARRPLGRLLARLGLPPALIAPATKTGPLLVVALGTAAAWALALDERIAVVGAIPAGLPSIGLPPLDGASVVALAGSALLIAVVGFMESVSVAKALAGRRRQKIDPDRELLALGGANLAASVSGGMPVTGGFSRSVVNFEAGAASGLASLTTALLMALAVLFLTPLLHFLPQAVLAAVIVVAVAGLLDLRALREVLRYDRADGLVMALTFAAVLALGIEPGLVAGLALSLGLFLFRTSRPHVAVVGRVGDSEHFRNIRRHTVATVPEVLLIRVDESFYFANTRALEQALLTAVADEPRIRHVVLIMSAANAVDASAVTTLEELVAELRAAGVTLHLAEVKGPVMDRLQRSRLLEALPPGRVFLSTHEASRALGGA